MKVIPSLFLLLAAYTTAAQELALALPPKEPVTDFSTFSAKWRRDQCGATRAGKKMMFIGGGAAVVGGGILLIEENSSNYHNQTYTPGSVYLGLLLLVTGGYTCVVGGCVFAGGKLHDAHVSRHASIYMQADKVGLAWNF